MTTRKHLDGGGVARAGLVLLVTLGIGACKGGGSPATPDVGAQDVPVPVDQQTTDTPVTPDAGVDDSMDAAVVVDAPVLEDCAPLPTGGATPSGTAPMQDAGAVVASTATRPELSDDVAAGRYTMRKALEKGYLINMGVAPDGGVGPVTYSLNDNWDPIANGIGDPSTFTPMYTVAADGSGTDTSLNTAFAKAIFLAHCGRVYIRVKPGEYREQVIVNSKTSSPPLTLYSTEADASQTKIVFNQAHATAGSMTLSATMTVKAIRGFQMKNLTVANDYVEGSAMGGQSAVALLVQSDQAQFENVRFLGNIATLYIKSLSETTAARSYFRDSYIEGDQDFIVGRGTAVFDHTEIRYLTGRQPSGGVIGYPSTLVFNDYGFLFDSCNFTAEAGASGVSLGRQWVEESDSMVTRGMPVGKMIVRNSTLGAHLAGAAPWSSTGARVTTPKTPAGTTPVVVYTSADYYPAGVGPAPAEPFLAEYRNSGPGAHQ